MGWLLSPISIQHLNVVGLSLPLSCSGHDGATEVPKKGWLTERGPGNGFYHLVKHQISQKVDFCKHIVKINPSIIIDNIKNALWVIVLGPPGYMFSRGAPPPRDTFPDSLLCQSNPAPCLAAPSSTLPGPVPLPYFTAISFQGQPQDKLPGEMPGAPGPNAVPDSQQTSMCMRTSYPHESHPAGQEIKQPRPFSSFTTASRPKKPN